MKILWIHNEREFILIKLCLFYEKQVIVVKYLAPYIYKDNGLAKQEGNTFIIIKNLILINNNLLNNFLAKIIETANYFWNKFPTKNRNHSKIIFPKA